MSSLRLSRTRRVAALAVALAAALIAGAASSGRAAGPVPVNTTPPTISGPAALGATLTEAHGSWNYTPTSFAVQWYACDAAGNACTAIDGATGQTYAITGDDLGHTLRVVETATGAGGTSVPAASAPTGVVAAVPVSTAAPTVTGHAVVGRMLGCTTGAWRGTEPWTYSYVWLADGNPIAGAIAPLYKPAASDKGRAVGCAVTATNVAGSATARSGTVVVAAAPACSGLAGAALGACRARLVERAALARCGAISTRTATGRARKAACAARAKLAYKRAVAVAGCRAIKSSAERAACLARARKIKR